MDSRHGRGLGQGEKETPTITRVTGRAPLADGRWLALRGARAPLAWSFGYPARAVGPDFRLVFTELVGAPVRRRLAHVVFCGGLLFGVVVACCSCVMITGVYLFDWSRLVVRDI